MTHGGFSGPSAHFQQYLILGSHRSEKNCMRIHWTFLRNFHFLHQPHNLHCLKAITSHKYVSAYLHALRAHACTYCTIFHWFILDTYMKIVQCFIKIRVHLAEKLRCVLLAKLHAHFHTLCVHVCTCMPMKIINQLRRPILTYAESFMKI